MAVTLFASGTQSATVTTEHFLSSPNVAGLFVLQVDLVNMVAGDVVELRAYKMVLTGGTTRVTYFAQFAGPQATNALIAISAEMANTLTDTNAVRFSLTQTFGTSRNFPWAVINEEDFTSVLAPTVAGRTLDVSAAGNAGIDWSNIEAPTTAQNLSATNIDVDQVVASVSGAVGSVTGAVGSVAAGGITATSIAADAIGASELAADAATEIANAVWDMDATGHQTGGTFGQAIGDPGADTNTIFKATVTDATGVTVGTDTATLLTRVGTPSDLGGGATVAANLADIEGQTDDIGAAGAGLTAIPSVAAIGTGGIVATSFAAGAIDATAIAANAIGASELAADAVDEIWDEAIAELAQGAPSATPAMRAALAMLYMMARNQITVDAAFKTFSNDAGTVVFKKAVDDNGTTYTETEMETGP